MKTLQFPLAIAALTCLLTTAMAQNTPTDIPKKELPKKAICAVCAAKGGGEEEEKPASGVRYRGDAYLLNNPGYGSIPRVSELQLACPLRDH